MHSAWSPSASSEQDVHQDSDNSAQVVIEDDAPRYDAEVLADLEASGVNVVVASGAEHGLDIEGDAVGSASLLAQLITQLRDFGFR